MAEQLEKYSHPELVASTFSIENNRMVPGITSKGPRVVSFDSILKYGRYPLAQIINELLQLCKKEQMCDVEMEFAADIIPGTGRLVLNLLQVRPVGEFSEDRNTSYEKVSQEIESVIVESSNALGSGYLEDMQYVIYVPSETFDSAKTREMAAEVSEMNRFVKEKGASCLLVGPGRWGSSDPWLGIPVQWSDISEARMIVETAIQGYRIEPSQGTHFFQNITSLGVGYLTIDTVRGDGTVNEELLMQLECVTEGKYVRLCRTQEKMIGYIDRSSNRAIVGY